MEDSRTTVCVSIDLALAPTAAFAVLIEELATALAQKGMSLELGPHGCVTAGKLEVGRITSWKPGELLRLQWHQADWNIDEITDVELRLEPVDGGTRV